MGLLRLAAVVLIGAAGLGLAAQSGPSASFDVLIAGGRVVDGTGAPWFRADVGLVGDRITRIGDLHAATATRRIDATGLVVAPGFIDMLGQSEFNVLVDNRAASKILQGRRHDGGHWRGHGSSWPNQRTRWSPRSFAGPAAHYHITVDWRSLSDYFARLTDRTHPAINIGTFVGAGGVREYVIGKSERAATPADLLAMKRLVAQAMEQGALGLSSALQYVPDRFATTDELVDLATVAASYGGIYITHQRSESGKIFESLDEVFAIAERAKIPAEIFHLKTAYKANWGKMPEVLARIRAARDRGLDITANQYPYVRASNGLDACLPLWAREGGKDAMIARLNSGCRRAERANVRRTTWHDSKIPPTGGRTSEMRGSGSGDGVMLSSVINPDQKKYEGRTLSEIGRAMGEDPRDAVMDVLIADHAESQVITSIMSEDDVKLALKDPLVAIGTDAGAMAEDGPLSDTKSHPRAWGSYSAHSPVSMSATEHPPHARRRDPQDDVAPGHAHYFSRIGASLRGLMAASRCSIRQYIHVNVVTVEPQCYSSWREVGLRQRTRGRG